MYRQKQYSPMAVEEQVPLIYAGVNGHLDSVPVNRIGQFEEGKSSGEALSISVSKVSDTFENG